MGDFECVCDQQHRATKERSVSFRAAGLQRDSEVLFEHLELGIQTEMVGRLDIK